MRRTCAGPGRPRQRWDEMTHSEIDAQAGPVQVRGTVLTVRRVDAYYAMTGRKRTQGRKAKG